MSEALVRDKIFVSYSHKDRWWLEEFQRMMTPHVRSGKLLIWSDTCIPTGSHWRKEIDKALSESRVAVLAISDHFMHSDFIQKIELPSLLHAAQEDGLQICWCLLSACIFEDTTIGTIQAAHDISKSFDKMAPAQRKETLKQVAKSVMSLYESVSPSISHQQEIEDSWQRENSRTGRSKTAVLTATDTAFIELTINQDFDNFSHKDQERLLQGIAHILKVSDAEIRIRNKRRGSVIVSLELSSVLAEKLLIAAREGKLNCFGVVKANPTYQGGNLDIENLLSTSFYNSLFNEIPAADRSSIRDTEGVGFTLDEFASLLNKYDYNYKPGDVVNGTVFALESKGAMIDIGVKTAAFMPLQELSINRVEHLSDVLEVGEIREFFVLSEKNEYGQLTLSIRQIEYQRAWQRVRQLQKEDVTIYGEVFATNREGAMVRVEGLQGFIPRSHIGNRKAKEQLVSDFLPLKFLDVDEERNRLVLSHRRALVECMLNSHEVGEVVIGTVCEIKPYGAFIDIGGVRGLLHISEISHDHIDTPHTILNVYDRMKVMIIDIDAERGRLSLSTKALEAEPGDMLTDPQKVFDKAEETAARYKQKHLAQVVDTLPISDNPY
jgi:small subunit ribosomal protein S1